MAEKVTINTQPVKMITDSSSKGNQPKWFADGKWYKADHMGYEALSEIVISKLLVKTNIQDFVIYKPTYIAYEGKKLVGCYSENFKKDNETIYTLEKLFRAFTGKSLAKALLDYPEVKDKIKFTVDFIEEHTNLKNVGEYLTAMLELDAFFLNEDRHTNNIAFIRDDDTEEFRFCPYFDFGLSLLSDTNDYPPDADVYDCIAKVKAKPFDSDFDLQMDAAEELYGVQLKINFTENDIVNAVDECKEYYDEATLKRVTNILLARRNKFKYLIGQS